MKNIVYIATSLDGFIADKNNGIEWLHDVPNPDNDDLGFAEFMANIDALVMGRNTLELVLSFGIDWPYNKHVFVLSNTLTELPEAIQDNVTIVNGDLKNLVENLNQQGYQNLYIDGGVTIQNFLKADLIDEMIITTIPIVLGGGIPLFGELTQSLKFKNIGSKRLLDCLVQNHYQRMRA